MIVKWKQENVEVLWGNANAPNFGTMWRQARSIGFKPKAVFISRAAANYIDVSSWGGDLPLGLGLEVKWFPTFDTHGIGDTTPKSLLERWTKETKQPLNDNIGLGYYVIQVLADAIERAGTLDTDAVNKAMAETDLETINSRVKFDDNHFNYIPMSFAQWQKTDEPEKWAVRIVSSVHDFVRPDGDLIFPIPYE
jgi:branched-chain amino acid transport system substrate-binding protein